MTAVETLILASYFFVLLILAVYGWHRYYLVYVYMKHKHEQPQPKGAFDALPVVTIQLPLYNEMYVVDRLLDAVCQIDYPRERLEIQVLDDSTDDTTSIARGKVEELRERGFDAELQHRENRIGFKAGALAAGMQRRPEQYIAIFDADFIPNPDYLKRAYVALSSDERLAFVQGRWEHLNANTSPLTRAQAMSLDVHFGIEQAARSWSGLPMPFNGSGGLWRRRAIEDAGGWEFDTLTEDLDLSVRATLRGWRSRFLIGLGIPAEIPESVTAWRNQQFRWTKGFAQTAIKHLPAIWRSKLPLSHKLSISIPFIQGWVYPAGMLALVSGLGALSLASGAPAPELIFGLVASLSGVAAVFAVIAAGQLQLKRPINMQSAIGLATVIALNSGLALSNTRAIYEAVVGRQSAFVRTPKRGDSAKPAPSRSSILSGVPELGLAALSVAVVVAYDAWYSPFLAFTVAGLTIVGAAAFGAARGR